MKRSIAKSLLAVALAASLNLGHAHTPNASDASALSMLPVAISVAAPVVILSGGAVLTVVAVEASAGGTLWVLERASDGARASVTLSAAAAGGVSVIAGTAVVVTAFSARLGLVGCGAGLVLHPQRDRQGLASQRTGDVVSARALLTACALTLGLAVGSAAHAGRSCEAKPPQAINVQRAMTLAERTAAALDARGAQVVVIARNGQDLGRYGLRWSHLGLAYKDGPVWRVAHKLNQCGSAQAALYRQGLGEFFLDDLHRYEAGIVVLKPELQHKLLPLLRDNARLAQLNEPAYNMVAYPWSQRYQQSNQWAIETLAMSQEPTASNRERAQAWLQFKGYEPTALNIPALTRLGARMSAANVAFDDHPTAKRFADRIETVTVDSVFAWLERSGLGARMEVVR